jgi:hypothetical protein
VACTSIFRWKRTKRGRNLICLASLLSLLLHLNKSFTHYNSQSTENSRLRRCPFRSKKSLVWRWTRKCLLCYWYTQVTYIVTACKLAHSLLHYAIPKQRNMHVSTCIYVIICSKSYLHTQYAMLVSFSFTIVLQDIYIYIYIYIHTYKQTMHTWWSSGYLGCCCTHGSLVQTRLRAMDF